MSIKHWFVAGGIALAASTGAASAVTINVQGFGGDVAAAREARDLFIAGSANSRIIIEDFEGFKACTGTNVAECDFTPIDSKVGKFQVIPGDGAGAGQSVVDPVDQAVIRDVPQFGRKNTTIGGTKYLDSNDQKGIFLGTWNTMPKFDRMAFFLMDIDDVATLDFRITAREMDDDGFAAFLNDVGGSNNDVRLVTIDFGMNVSNARIRMLNGFAGQPAEPDGFAVDDFYVAAVPLPAAGWLLIAGIGGLFAMGRRRKAA